MLKFFIWREKMSCRESVLIAGTQNILFLEKLVWRLNQILFVSLFLRNIYIHVPSLMCKS